MTQTSIEIMERRPRDRFDVGVAVLAVVTTLVAASLGFLFALASNAGDEARARAQERTLEAVTASAHAAKEVEAALKTWEIKREREVRASLAHEAGLAREEARWSALARSSDRAFRTHAILSAGPDSDVLFPLRFRTDKQRPALTALALRDAENEVASAWGKRGSSYAAILTLLTVALYLLGFSLTDQARSLRGLFASVGTAFLLLGVVFGPIRAISPEPHASRDAAQAFAAGTIALADARSPEDYGAARRDFDRAISARAGFAPAYLARARAAFGESSPQYAAFPSLTTPTARRATVNDLRMALALGLQSPALLTDLGFQLFALGLEDDRPELLAEGKELTGRAIAEYAKSDPVPLSHEPTGRCRRFDLDRSPDAIPLFNLAAARLAAGQRKAARAGYELAICASLARGAELDLISGALTDLELIARHGPLEVQGEIRRLKEVIVGSVAAGTLREPSSQARLNGVSIFIEAGYAQFNIASADNLSRDTEAPDNPDRWLSAQWYFQDPSGLGWSQLPYISGPLPLQRDELDTRFAFRNYVGSALERCLPDGRYRVELYDQGQLVGQAEARYDQGARLIAFHDAPAGVVGCRPAEWTAARTPLATGYVSVEGDRGFFVTRLDAQDVRGRADEEAQAVPLLRRAIGRWSAPLPALEHTGSEFLDFMGLGSYRHSFVYAGGRAVGGVGRDSDGSLVAAVVYGPAKYFQREDNRPEQIVGSAEPDEIIGSLAVTDTSAAVR